MNKPKLNLKQPKYIFPLIALPFVLFIGYTITGFMEKEEVVENNKDLSTSLGEVEESILSKDEAYDKLFKDLEDKRTMIDGLEDENDTLFSFNDNLDYNQKRFIDSLRYVNDLNRNKNVENNFGKSYYNPVEKEKSQSIKDDEPKNIFELLKDIRNGNSTQDDIVDKNNFNEEPYNPLKAMREQMLFLDSLEKSKDPSYKAMLEAENRLKADNKKLNDFLSTTQEVKTTSTTGGFNHISKNKNGNIIKAVIDENIKGYLGSRVRFRLLDDVYIGKDKVKKGTVLYGEISGFSMQRVNLSIVSIMVNNEIKPINLSVYDMDGMKGLYVPASMYREMMRQLGQNSTQGMRMEGGEQSFFQSMFTQIFRSTSQTLISVIQKNKVSLKYNSHIYLINEKDLRKNENNDE